MTSRECRMHMLFGGFDDGISGFRDVEFGFSLKLSMMISPKEGHLSSKNPTTSLGLWTLNCLAQLTDILNVYKPFAKSKQDFRKVHPKFQRIQASPRNVANSSLPPQQKLATTKHPTLRRCNAALNSNLLRAKRSSTRQEHWQSLIARRNF
jgi:hypothetical protein